MILRYSFKSILRTPGKTILFLLLLCAVTGILCLGIGMWYSGEQLLSDANQKFMTVAVLDYTGNQALGDKQFADQRIADINAFDFEKLYDDNVIAVDKNLQINGYVEGFTRLTGLPYPGHAVLIVKPLTFSEDKNYTMCRIVDSLYSFDGKEEVIVNIPPATDSAGNKIVFETDRFYAVIGKFTQGTSIKRLQLSGIRNLGNGIWGFDDNSPPYVTEITDYEDFLASGDSAVYRQLAETYWRLNNSLSVTATNRLEALPEFHQQQTYLTEGRSFSAEEYESGSDVCVLSQHLAYLFNVSVGDKIHMGLHYSDNVKVNGVSISESGFAHEGDYTVVGICKDTDSYRYSAYIPKNESGYMPELSYGGTVARIILKNGSAEEYYDKVKPLIPSAMYLSIYDQGYAQIEATITGMLKTGKLLSVISAVAALAVVFLFSFLFIAKQKETASIMLILGAGAKRTRRYFLFSAFFISFVAVALGSVTAIFLSKGVADLAYNLAQRSSTLDLRYSSVYFGTNIEFTAKTQTLVKQPLIVGAFLLLVVLILCLVFAQLVLRRSKPRVKKQKKVRIPKNRRSITGLSLPSLKFSLLSILRGGFKSFIIPLVSFVLAAFIFILGDVTDNYKAQLDEVYDTIPVKSYFTTVQGKVIDGLSLNESDLKPILTSDYVSRYTLTYGMVYDYMGVYSYADGTAPTEPPGSIKIPTSSFGIELFRDNLRFLSKAVLTSRLDGVPEFFFSGGSPEVQYLDGYDESVLESTEACCIVSSAFLREHGLSLGDRIKLQLFTLYNISDTPVGVKIVGVFSGGDNIYLPYKLLADVYKEYPYFLRSIYTYVRSATFELKNTERLGEFKDFLEATGYSSTTKTGSYRIAVVIDDRDLESASSNLLRHISYMKIIYIVMFILVAAVGFVVSYLLTKNRRPELAIMRSLGAGKLRTFLTFFIEQFMLCLLGCALALGIMSLAFGAPGSLHLLTLGGYALCYMLGSGISVGIMNHVDVLKSLSAKE